MRSTWGLECRLEQIAGDVAQRAFYLIRQDDSEKWSGDECELYVYSLCDFCGDCIDAIVDLIERKVGADNDEKGVSVGADDGESDVTKACHWCGVQLEYCLTNEGAAQEMEHFEQCPPDPRLTPHEAYALARILANGSADPAFIERVQRWLVAHGVAAR